MKNLFKKFLGLDKTKKIGLALSAGAAPALSHIGVIKALLENNVRIDFVAGSSMGALIGAYFAKTGEIASLEQKILAMDWKKLLNLVDVDIFSLGRGLLKGDKVRLFMEELLDNVTFEELKIPLSVIASEIKNGEEVLINSGPVVEAVRASISMPLLFVPVKINDKVLADGGSTNPLPIDVAQKMGAEFVIASHSIPSLLLGRSHSHNKENDKNMPAMYETFLQTLFTMQDKIASQNLELADLIVSPICNGVGLLEFHKSKQAIDCGYELTKKLLAENPSISA
jgi:NTE family protein